MSNLPLFMGVIKEGNSLSQHGLLGPTWAAGADGATGADRCCRGNQVLPGPTSAAGAAVAAGAECYTSIKCKQELFFFQEESPQLAHASCLDQFSYSSPS